jgi:PAS domain S-box-containing protein
MATSIPRETMLERVSAGVQALTEALSRALTTEQVAEAVFEHLLAVTGAAAGTLVLRTEAGDALELVGAVGYSDASVNAYKRIPVDASTPAAHVVRTRQPLWIESRARAADTFPSMADRATGHNALAVLPILLENEVSGALLLAFNDERPFQLDERVFLVAAAGQCSVALQRAAVFARERASRERLEVALRAASMGAWDWDLRTNQVTWSPELETIHGREPGAFGSGLDRYFDHLHADDRERVRAEISAALDSGELHLHYRGVWPNGDVHWYEARGQVTRDTDGRAVAVRGVCMDVSARTRAERALRESEERFRTLADNSAQFAWMADSTGGRFWYNRRWYEYTGTTLDEVQGWGWTKVHHPEHVDRVVQGFKKSSESGTPWEDTFPLRGQDGQYRWFLSRAVPIRDQQGQIVRWLGTNTDITERRWTEALVVGERNALESIARGSPITEVLAGLCQTVEGLGEDGLLASILLLDSDGIHLRHGAAPSLPDAYNRAIDGVAIGPSVGSCGTAAFRGEQVVVTDIATDPLWAEYRQLADAHGLRACWSTPIRALDGQILGTFALYYNRARAPTAEHLRLAALVGRTAALIIERKRADDVRARLAAIVDSSDDEITGCTLEGIVTTWNAAATRLYGYTTDEMVGRPMTDIIPFDQLSKHEAVMVQVRRGERVPPWDTIRLDKAGHRMEVSLSLSPILDETGGVIGVSAIGRDARERLRLEAERDRLLAAEHAAREQAEGAISARDEFVAVVSHDLRNPLAALKGQLQMVRRRAARGEAPSAEQLVERLDLIQASIAALSAQIDELHDATYLQAGRPVELRPRPTDLVALARECARGQQHTSDAHRVRFESTLQELVGQWDPDRLERVLANLLSNAIKYSPAGGEVLVQVARDEDHGVVSVIDWGLGIPEVDLPHVFERFRRASNVGARIAGSGLGLAGARDIIEQHGGTINVKSEEGRGSTFEVRLPVDNAR